MIELCNISKKFANFSLENISLAVRAKEYLVILGPTGAGKTLLLETIAGISLPDRGKILMEGKDITLALPAKRHVGMVYQDYMLFPHLTLQQNIAFGLEARKLPRDTIKKKVQLMAEMLGISHLLQRYPKGLSGGEQQRATIGRALVTEPAALLLDEPLSAVDEFTAERLQVEIKKLHKLTGATTLHITHRFDEAYALADRIAIMNRGRIVQLDTPENIFRRPVNSWVARFVGCKNLFQGKAAIENGGCTVTALQVPKDTPLQGEKETHQQGMLIKSLSKHNGEVMVSVRPEDIFISNTFFTEPGLNSFAARVRGIVDRGRLIEAELDAGIPLVTVLSRQSAQKMELRSGRDIYITIRTEDVHLFIDTSR
ncbi:MAG: ATP-binding cassette domain-containing protein [bacterium]|nr:ATP-binding cassette domain-containing protein [bacterium]